MRLLMGEGLGKEKVWNGGAAMGQLLDEASSLTRC